MYPHKRERGGVLGCQKGRSCEDGTKWDAATNQGMPTVTKSYNSQEQVIL